MLKKMELKEGAGVFTSSGEQVGKINRFVLDPATNEVTHIVIQKGWLLPEDKVVPIRMVNSASEERVVLSRDVGDFDQLPPFEERHFVRAASEDIPQGEHATYENLPAYYWYPPAGYIGYPAYGLEYYPWPPVETRRNIPEETVPLKEGSNVMSADEKHVGDVERLLVESDSNRATHFVITRGVFLKERKLVPAQWVRSIEENKVHLIVSSQLLERLPPYTP
jgi:uncharacterized protein YrrD